MHISYQRSAFKKAMTGALASILADFEAQRKAQLNAWTAARLIRKGVIPVPLSRKEALSKNLPFYLSTKPCPAGHIGLRKLDNRCAECRRLDDAVQRAKVAER